MFLRMYNKEPELRFHIVKHYLETEDSLRKTAQRFYVNYKTVFKWVKWYNEEGVQRLFSTYRRPWNRTKKELEKKIVLLKENDPAITIRKAKEILGKQGIMISIKGVWGIWKRYGYVGFNKENKINKPAKYDSWSREAHVKFEGAKELVNRGKIEEAARILNSIPFLPKNELILEIPNHLLNLRRRAEKIPSLSGKIPIHSYLRKIKNIFEELKRKNLYYTALRIGINEVVALGWCGKPEELLKRTKELKRMIKNNGNYLLFKPYFRLLIAEGITYASLLKTKRSYEIARTCRRLLKRKKYPSYYFLDALGTLYLNLEEYREAERLFLKALDKVDEETNKYIKGKLAAIELLKGKYKKAANLSKNAEFGVWISHSRIQLFRSLLFLIKGLPQKTILLATESLLLSRKEEINPDIFGASFIIASAYCSIGEKAKAKKILTRVLPIFEKKHLEKYVTILNIFLSGTSNESKILLNKDVLPTVKLALFLKNRHYKKAFSYATKKYLLIYFYRYIFFFPEAVIPLLEKGKLTGLPKAILRLPVFNKEVPVYHISFLGNLIVYKNQKYLRLRLQPKDRAFFIHLALKAGEPEKEIPLERIYRNFWKKSKNPPRNLSHLLVRIKRAVNIPSHLLEVSYKKDNPILVNKGIHFITDYSEYIQSLAQAKSLLRTREWKFAKSEFIRAFSLFRGEPFKKMYDDWSDDKRLEILFSYESEILSFAKELKKRGTNEEAEKLIKKAKKIVPFLGERD